ncbi:MAG: VWA domain-containing protein [Lentisphaeria bacterium]|nr:VWA domain-containing protein [Lentisphaeria bacterium]
MKLEYPWLLLLFIPYAAILFMGWTLRAPSIRVPGLAPFRRAAGGARRVNWRKLIPFVLFAIGGAAMIVAVAQPREGIEEIRSKADGIDIMIAVDLSPSMSAIDAPSTVSDAQVATLIQRGSLKNRIDTAKVEIARFIEERPNDRIGLIAFASLPYVMCPPTLDHAFLLANLERLSVGQIGDGTGIASPIASAVKRLKDSEAKSRILVLFTDGSNTVNGQITPRDAGKLADTFDITIYTVGIGSSLARIPVSTLFGGVGFQTYPNEFDETLLKELADMTGGRYYRAADAKGMAQAMNEINKLEKTSVEQPVVVNWRELYPWFCWLALGSVLLGLFFRQTLCLRLP